MKISIKEALFKFNSPRRAVQLLSFLLLSAAIFNLAAQPLVLPVLFTWGLPQNTVGDAFTALQFMLYNAVFPFLAIAAFLVTGIIIGKAMCGWVCPFGFVQDIIIFIKRKKFEVSRRSHDTMINMKYAILGIALFISVTFSISKVLNASASYESGLGIFTKAPFTTLSPGEMLFGSLPRMFSNFATALTQKSVADAIGGIATLPALFWVEFVIMGFVLVFAAYTPRSWCRYLCPHGAIMAIMNRFSFIGLRRDPVKCAKGGCRLCVQVCPMRVPILELPWQKFSDPECIYCMKCVDACKDKAIRVTYP